MYLQCLFKLDPTKMVKAHVMHIIINVKFYSVDMAKNLSKSWQATIRSIYVLLKLPCWFLISSFLDQTDFPLWKCQLLWNRNDLSFSKSSSLDVFWNFLCGIFNMMYTVNIYRALRGLFRFSLLWGNPVIFTDCGDIL